MMATIKLIHPKTGVVREVGEEREMKLAALKRAGFVMFEGYKPKVVKVPEPEPSLAEEVEGQAEKMEIAGTKVAAEKAIHGKVKAPGASVEVTFAAKKLIKKHKLDASLIEGGGEDGRIRKADVIEYMKQP